MSQSRRLLFYIVINVLVSACTTLAILWLWERSHPAVILPALPTAPAAAANGSTALTPLAAMTGQPIQATPAPPGEMNIAIENIFGAGNLADEVVIIRQLGDGGLALTNWQLVDGEENTFTFPELILYQDGTVQVHSAAGVNTVVDLYWGRDNSVWQSGETATLLDDQGQTRSTYRIP